MTSTSAKSVLILGATGSIGFDVALEFLRNGYTVYGLTRTEDNAKLLLKNEIIPVVGAVSDFEKWVPIAEKVNVVIEALADYSNLDTAQSVLNKFKEIKSTKNPQLVPIYTSGALVYGTSDKVVDENTPYNVSNNPFLTVRVGLENQYREIGGIVIQPSFVFGKKGSGSSLYYEGVVKNTDGNFEIFGEEGQWRAIVHITDLARLYYLAATKTDASRGQVFLGSAYYYKTADIVRSIAKESKKDVKAIKFIPPTPTNPMSYLLYVSNATSHQKSTNLLGWVPTQPSLIDAPTRYYNSWINNNSN
ncbi:hypothetical protein SAMD00019534_050480 [Acytostelium subglobosum LB1]|uniref:hypothetical protein n=1 Tax=Acytostelium subglobosum LB1 TaxID=1410327 RepID=UPI000644B8C5|nr:hypothetical protein SAMD00019534_050480 [Acytostelium subglobosum LB1]GAM21873.1 hypothetical protein SAMD00019534_050480 [Acytostelium subglobosum LB1]|eukprot:XP_012754973.1 hypothetical protein SAMD00019534_050480 [Acytostelium subglobosum LB1]